MPAEIEENGHPAVFLDRDGVLNENRSSYIRTWAEVEIFDQAIEALRTLSGGRHIVILVTNQSVVGRGLAARQEIEAINLRLMETIRAHGGRIDAAYICPHAPEDGCDCRKPLPGMIHQAAEAHGIDLSRSLMIGDAMTDLEAAKAAGIPTYALVRTGRGREQEKLLGDEMGEAGVFEDLKTALQALI
jgi:D-glycero-D-manno-heptose 1,7-bisphosphate phosphatase